MDKLCEFRLAGEGVGGVRRGVCVEEKPAPNQIKFWFSETSVEKTPIEPP